MSLTEKDLKKIVTEEIKIGDLEEAERSLAISNMNNQGTNRYRTSNI